MSRFTIASVILLAALCAPIALDVYDLRGQRVRRQRGRRAGMHVAARADLEVQPQLACAP